MPTPDQDRLPSGWPYALRQAGGELGEQQGHAIPGLGGGWTLRLVPGFTLDGAVEAMPEAFGRGGVFRLGDAVLRPYRRGGMVRHVNRSTYAGANRFQAEFEVHAWLYQQGFPTVQPLGYGFRRHGLGYQGLLLSRWLQATPWPATWHHGVSFLEALGTAIKALEAVGCWAPDLNATNVLVTPEGRPILLDWDRASFGRSGDVNGGLVLRYRERLLRSLQKMQAPSDVVLGLTKCLSDS